jgi:protein SCO1
MIARTLVAIALAAVTVACGERSDLPFYTDATFTPQWEQTPARNVTFALRAQTDRPFTHADLEGRIHIASFVYTRCSAICPMVMSRLAVVQSRFAANDAVRMVSYSVSPEDDTPATLAAFGADRGVDPRRWSLVTGGRAQIFALARSFYFADDGRFAGTTYDVLHTEKVLLVDRHERLRGVYNGTLAADIDRLITDAELLTAGPD